MRWSAIIILLFIGVGGYAQHVPTLTGDSTRKLVSLNFNSRWNDYGPIYEGNRMWFTSERKKYLGEQVIEEDENIYFTTGYDTSWEDPKRYSTKFNTGNNTALVFLDEKQMFLYHSSWLDNGDIFVVRRTDSVHRSGPKPFGLINSSFDETSIVVKNDSTFFVNNRSGNYDIYLQIGTGKPQALSEINSSGDEGDVFISPDNTLYFASNRDTNWNIYWTKNVEGKWLLPKALDFPYNTSSDERDFRIYSDDTLFFASNRPGGRGGLDIYGIQKIQYHTPDTIPCKDDSIPTEKCDSVPKIDTIVPVKVDTIIPIKVDTVILKTDTIVPIKVDTIIPVKVDTIVPKTDTIVPVKIDTIIPVKTDSVVTKKDDKQITELEEKLKELGLWPPICEIQVGAYRKIKGIADFKKRFPKIANEDLRIVYDIANDTLANGEIVFDTIYKYVINRIYYDLDSVCRKQLFLMKYGGLPPNKASIPFIALIKDNERYAIFWYKEQYMKREVFWINKASRLPTGKWGPSKNIWRSKL